ncbi:MAG: Cys-tRNA(Pro) deacylase [Chloroflexota bacterium]|nr:Cys-tRNA(Pro) deacylase [Chloroflexota bacterium]
MTTNAMRVLEQAAIPFGVRHFPVGEQHLSAEQVADAIDMAPETVFKTLITGGDQERHLFAVIPANTELDLKALASLSGQKRLRLVPLRDVQKLTGYVRGAVTVLAARRAFPVFFDETVELWPRVAVSAGERGMQLVLAPADFLRITGGQLGDIAR